MDNAFDVKNAEHSITVWILALTIETPLDMREDLSYIYNTAECYSVLLTLDAAKPAAPLSVVWPIIGL